MSDDLSDAVQDEGSAAGDAAAEAGDDASTEAAPDVYERPQASVPEPTGVQTVDAAVERLAELDALPTSEHVAVYDAVHRQLQDALADLDGA